MSRRLRTGDSVLLLDVPGQMKEFAGKTGRVVHKEKLGRERYYRIRMDKPVDIPGIGRVTDDLWTSKFLRKVH